MGVYLDDVYGTSEQAEVFPTHVGVYLLLPVDATHSSTVFPTHVGVYRILGWIPMSY